MPRKIADKARELAEPLAQGMGFEVIEVRYAKEGGDWYLRVYIDKRGGIMIDDCERLSKEYSDALDREDFIAGSYILEVSSPGLDRPLKTEADFRRYEGERVDIVMLPGRLKTGLRAEAVEAAETAEEDGQDKEKAEEDGRAKGKAKPAARKPGRGGNPTGRSGGPTGRDCGPTGCSGNPDMISGTLGRLENGRVYLSAAGGAYSVAWEDIKTVRRSIGF